MIGARNFFGVRYTPVSRSKGQGVDRFLRYLHYRDRIRTHEDTPDVDGFLSYVAHRDRAASSSRLFDGSGTVGAEERRALAAYIERSVEPIQRAGGPRSSTHNRASYDLVISPGNAAGVDLREVTRATLNSLQNDLGSRDLPPWIAAEHRNTRHPHVHLVLAARRELGDGHFRTVLLTRERVSRMKAAALAELERQQHRRDYANEATIEDLRAASRPMVAEGEQSPALSQQRTSVVSPEPDRSAGMVGLTAFAANMAVAQLAANLARRYRLEAEREARRRGYASAREREDSELGRERAA